MESDSLSRDPSIELDRLIRLAHLQSIRKQWVEATETCNKALEISPQNIDVLVTLGDILMERGRIDEALSAYRTAHDIDPANGSVETKYAKVTLMVADREYEIKRQSLPEVQLALKRSWVLAFFASSMFPGLGQLYNHEMLKAQILLIAAVISIILARFSPPFWGVFGAIYIYAVIDAASSAQRINKALENKSSAKQLDIK